MSGTRLSRQGSGASRAREKNTLRRMDHLDASFESSSASPTIHTPSGRCEPVGSHSSRLLPPRVVIYPTNHRIDPPWATTIEGGAWPRMRLQKVAMGATSGATSCRRSAGYLAGGELPLHDDMEPLLGGLSCAVTNAPPRRQPDPWNPHRDSWSHPYVHGAVAANAN